MPRPMGAAGAAWIVQHAAALDREAVITAPTAVRPPTADDDDRTVDVEWRGEPSALSDPLVEYRRILTRQGAPGGYTPEQDAVITAASILRIARAPKHSRELTKDRDGLSQDYVWGSKVGTYVRSVRYRDAERIKALPSGHEFRIVGHEPEPSPIATSERYIRLVGAQEFDRIETLAALARGRRA